MFIVQSINKTTKPSDKNPVVVYGISPPPPAWSRGIFLLTFKFSNRSPSTPTYKLGYFFGVSMSYIILLWIWAFVCVAFLKYFNKLVSMRMRWEIKFGVFVIDYKLTDHLLFDDLIECWLYFVLSFHVCRCVRVNAFQIVRTGRHTHRSAARNLTFNDAFDFFFVCLILNQFYRAMRLGQINPLL